MGIIDSFFDKVPNIHSVHPDVEKAIKDEIASYGLEDRGKSSLITQSVLGSMSAHYDAKSNLAARIAALPPGADRQNFIRRYIRQHVQDEIDLSYNNSTSEALSRMIEGPKLFETLDPRGKDYEKYREGVTNFFFSDADLKEKSSESSTYGNDLQDTVKAVNDGTKTMADLQNQKALYENSIHANLQNAVYNPATGKFESYEEIMIGKRLDKAKEKGEVVFRNNAEREVIVQKIKSIRSGAATPAVVGLDAHFTRKGRNNANLVGDLKEDFTKIVVDPRTGKVSLEGDYVKEIFSSGLSSSKKTVKIKTQASKGLRDMQLSHFTANIADLSATAVSSSATAGQKVRANALIEKNRLAADILNIAEASKNFSKLSGASLTQYNTIKANIEAQVLAGAIKFKDSQEQNAFLTALRSNNFKELQHFLKPGVFGNTSINSFFNTINKELIEFGAKTDNKAIAGRALNYANNFNFFRKEALNEFIWACQIATDPGYAFKEGIKALKEKYGIKSPDKFDAKALLWKQTYKILERFGANPKKLDAIRDFYKDPSKAAKERLLDIALARGIDLRNFEKGLWYKIKNSYFAEKAKEKLMRNLRYLQGRARLALGKLGGGVFRALNKISGNALSGVSRFIARRFGSLGNFLGNSLFKGLPGGGATFDQALKVIAIAGCGCSLLFFIPILGILSTIISAFWQPDPLSGGSETNPVYPTKEVNLIPSSGNLAVSSLVNAYPAYSGWNNLKFQDFVGTDNANNCNIMTEARKLMGTLFPGNGKLLNLNSQFLDNFQYVGSDIGDSSIKQFWCTYLITKSYKTMDPGIIQNSSTARVVGLDKYLSDNSDKYKKTYLALPTFNGFNIDIQPQCVKRSDFQGGNIIIQRHGTCNDAPPGGAYQKPAGGNSTESTTEAHTEMVLKLEGDTLYTISSNNSKKKIGVSVTSEGCASDEVKVTGFQKIGSDKSNFLYYCKMYQLVQSGAPASCVCSADDPASKDKPECQMPPNNYPDVPNAISSN